MRLSMGTPLPLGEASSAACSRCSRCTPTRTVGADELIDGSGPSDPPAERRQEPPVTTSRSCARHWPPTAQGPASSPAGRGYELRLAEGRSTRCASRNWSRRPLASRRALGPTALAGAALELWRGAPLADVASEPFAGPRDRPPRGASPAGDRAGDRCRAGRRAPRRGDRPARGPDRRGAVARAPARAADARPLSRRAPVGGARRLPRGARGADRADRGRAGPRAEAPAGADPRPGPDPRRAAADRRAADRARGRHAAARRARARA